VPREIAGMGEQADRRGPEPSRDQRLLRLPSGAHRDVGIPPEQILDPVAGREFYFDRAIGVAELREDRRQDFARHDIARGEADDAALDDGFAGHGPAEGGLCRGHRLGMRHQFEGGLCRKEPARGAREESGADGGFECCDMAASSRLREAETARGGRQAAVAHDVEKGAIEIPGGRGLWHAILYGNNTHSVNFRLSFLLAIPRGSTTEAHMSGNRRKFLIAAGGAGLALVGVGGAFVATRRPSRGLRAWAQAETTTSDVRLDAFRRAILAPNPHNRQPWQIRLVGDDTAIITCDLERRLPQTDPFDRQITIGFGCFLELARIAAAERGYRMDMTVFPDGEPQPRLNSTPIARLKFVADASVPKDPLFSAIVRRRSSKVAFEQQRSVDPAVLAGLTNVGIAGALSQATSDPALVSDLRSLTWRAWMIEAGTAHTWMESVDLMRIGRAEIEANPDGIALGGAIIEALAVTGQVTRVKLADPNASAFKMGVDRYRSMLERTSSYLWISTPANTRADQVAAGRAYVRLNLAATAEGIAVHPVSQALQEFPEMAGELDDLHRRLGIVAPARVQMLARIGYAAAVEPTVRWPLDAKVLGSSA